VATSIDSGKKMSVKIPPCQSFCFLALWCRTFFPLYFRRLIELAEVPSFQLTAQPARTKKAAPGGASDIQILMKFGINLPCLIQRQIADEMKLKCKASMAGGARAPWIMADST
jgi:hypothetical protein